MMSPDNGFLPNSLVVKVYLLLCFVVLGACGIIVVFLALGMLVALLALASLTLLVGLFIVLLHMFVSDFMVPLVYEIADTSSPPHYSQEP